ncbi:hypothetical protein F5884DRAFT_859807 [Xylogone sp. PMI_703]|nr:hypothetical protein F5884DRAFT_859807 [Xylogone sp. PMI_703]
MFGRRRPILGTAVVVAASRSAARHEVARQSENAAQTQAAAYQAAEAKRLEQERNDRRMQEAIDKALADERKRVEMEELQAQLEAQKAERARDTGSARPPPYFDSPVVDYNRPANPQGKAVATQFCPQCCNVCSIEDRFCGRCGHKLVTKEANEQAKQNDFPSKGVV